MQDQPQIKLLLANGELDRLQPFDDRARQAGDVQHETKPDGCCNVAFRGGQPFGPRKGVAQREDNPPNQRQRQEQRHCEIEQRHLRIRLHEGTSDQYQHQGGQREHDATQAELTGMERTRRTP